jgi:lysophospholipase L1-like esterase
MKTIAAAAALVMLASAARAGVESQCYVPSFLTAPGESLSRVAAAVKQDRKLNVVIFSGSPSQTGGAKGLRSYPTYLESALRDQLPDVEVKVEVRAKGRQSTGELLTLLPKLLEETKPTLVVWQAGTVDAFRHTDSELFGRNLLDGISAFSARNADAVLLNMQYSPRTDHLIDYASYASEFSTVADTAKVPLFDRYEIMRYWNVSGAFDLNSLRDDGLYEKIHVCIGELLADFILRGAGLKEDKGIGG